MKNKKFDYYNLEKAKDYVNLKGHNVLIWGLGESALRTLIDLVAAKINVIGFTDSYSEGGEFAGYPIYSADKINELGGIVLYISTRNVDFITDILYKVEELQLSNVKVVCKGHVARAKEYDLEHMRSEVEREKAEISYVRDMLADDKSIKTFDLLIKYRITNERKYLLEAFDNSHSQYFPKDGILCHKNDEVFVDAGGYDGWTTIGFANWAGKQYKGAYILEADDTMFNVCRELISMKHIPNTKIVKKAVYSKSGSVTFDNNNFDSGSGMISGDEGVEVECISIDELLNGAEATFIKMDIEGSEMNALYGAEKTISKYRPKLAISIYHWDNDLWKIPLYLMKKYPFYKFYIRHYTKISTETVLYASL